MHCIYLILNKVTPFSIKKEKEKLKSFLKSNRIQTELFLLENPFCLHGNLLNTLKAKVVKIRILHKIVGGRWDRKILHYLRKKQKYTLVCKIIT